VRTNLQAIRPGDATPGVRPDTALSVTGLSKAYNRRIAVQDISMSVRRGEAVGLLGPTVFYMVVGLVQPDVGAIHLEGQDVTNLPMYRRAQMGIGYLPQEASIFRGMNVQENILSVLELSEPDRGRQKQMLSDLMSEFRISHLRRVSALALSGGERRRLEVARALATRPRYILLDEPLAGLDPLAVDEVRDLIGHLKHRQIGVLVTDHNVREMLDIVDRAYVMHEGHLLMEGRPEQVVTHESVRRIYLGESFRL
jgi:lipopolysaccharide export system ATP-binding protein